MFPPASPNRPEGIVTCTGGGMLRDTVEERLCVTRGHPKPIRTARPLQRERRWPEAVSSHTSAPIQTSERTQHKPCRVSYILRTSSTTASSSATNMFRVISRRDISIPFRPSASRPTCSSRRRVLQDVEFNTSREFQLADSCRRSHEPTRTAHHLFKSIIFIHDTSFSSPISFLISCFALFF